VRLFAVDMGFSRIESQELAIVASELASNILKYGTKGELIVQTIMGDRGPCIELVAIDNGPPFSNLESALKDGWDQQGPIEPAELLKRKGIGGGLGAIIRLTDSFSVEEQPRCKQVITRRYLSSWRPGKPHRIRS
jgi:anti-sigma regulatory factor (Ser/Thr protein kinase)